MDEELSAVWVREAGCEGRVCTIGHVRSRLADVEKPRERGVGGEAEDRAQRGEVVV
jgi:hypothetical protein